MSYAATEGGGHICGHPEQHVHPGMSVHVTVSKLGDVADRAEDQTGRWRTRSL